MDFVFLLDSSSGTESTVENKFCSTINFANGFFGGKKKKQMEKWIDFCSPIIFLQLPPFLLFRPVFANSTYLLQLNEQLSNDLLFSTWISVEICSNRCDEVRQNFPKSLESPSTCRKWLYFCDGNKQNKQTFTATGGRLGTRPTSRTNLITDPA